MRGVLWLCLGITLLASACAGGTSPAAAPAPGATAPAVQAPKRIVAAIQGEPKVLSYKVDAAGAGGTPGVDNLEELLNAGLVKADDKGNVIPQLAVEVPSLENGLWTLAPDGRMETTWHIRPDARWHDGTSLTATDLLFTAQVSQDTSLPVFTDPANALIDSITAPDPSTVVVSWKGPFLRADSLFSRLFSHTLPLPAHLLATDYAARPASFTDLPYWTDQFVGLGPFKLQDFARGSHMTLVANDAYVLGRPKLDEIEVRFIGDSTSLVANVLAGQVELTLGRGLSIEQAQEARSQWQGGQVVLSFVNWTALFPQYIDPNPAIIGNVEFRRALLYATDRQAIVDSLLGGLVPVADGYLSPQDQANLGVADDVVRYPFDLARAEQTLRDLGITKGADGVYHDATGAPLAPLEVRASEQIELQPKALLAVTAQWQQAGFPVTPVVIPNQRIPDKEYRATMPGFELVRQPNDVDAINRYHSAQVPLPENHFTGVNRARYRDPVLDELIDRYDVTIPQDQRREVLRQLIHRFTDQVVVLGLYYEVDPSFVGNRLLNIGLRSQLATQSWNAEQWDVK